jgi:hypothetical protein
VSIARAARLSFARRASERQTVQRLFPDATIHHERVLRLTKSLMAVR